jgi:TolB protein
MKNSYGTLAIPVLMGVLSLAMAARAAEPAAAGGLIGYTELQTNLPGGRYANIRTMRAVVANADGSGRREVAASLVDGPEAWTQFAGWSPDGKLAVVSRGWEDPENAKWEEEHKTFRFGPGKWLLDTCLIEMETGKITNVTAVDRVSDYNGGLFFLPEQKGLGFTPLIGEISKPYVMDLDGRNKRDVSGKGTGFTYGYSASPDGKLISYHENYQVYIANVDGSDKRHIKTGHPFDFAPRWSPDGEWLLFVSGEHYHHNPYVVKRDGSGLKKLADLGGYHGFIEFLDVPDYHHGSSDLPVWSADGRSVFYTAKVEGNVALFQITLGGEIAQLTKTPAGKTLTPALSQRERGIGTHHYHPTPSPDGKKLLYGAKRGGVRQLVVMDLEGRSEKQITDLKAGHAAMWPHWQPKPPGR